MQQYQLYTLKDKLIIKSLYAKTKTYLIIEKDSSEYKTQESFELEKLEPTLSFYGLFGVYRFLYNEYLVLIKHSVVVGTIQQNEVIKIIDFEVVPVSKLHKEDLYYLELLKYALNKGTFYYSDTYDLTNPIDKQNLNNNEFEINMAGWRKELLGFYKKSINGFYEEFQTTIDSHIIQYKLLSRRSRLRIGSRFFSRGMDEEGNCSNYTETEQLVIIKNDTIHKLQSFVQIRASIPLFWGQVINLKYTPQLMINKELEITQKSFEKHFLKMKNRYQNINIINLVNNKGYEHNMKIMFEYIIKKFNLKNKNNQIGYTYFDFHKKCKNMRFENVELLIKELDQKISDYKYCLIDLKKNKDNNNLKEIEQSQNGVFRTNCMDCLDRTNVVQNKLARKLLLKFVEENSNDIMPQILDIEMGFKFRNLWADHANAISVPYSGTGALKTDFTRFGKRTYKGIINDGINSIQRYYINNFKDGQNQDAMDILTGNYTINLKNHILLKSGLIGLASSTALMASVSLLVTGYYYYYGNTQIKLISTMFTCLIFVTVFGIINRYPVLLLNVPKLRAKLEFDRLSNLDFINNANALNNLKSE